MNPIVGLMSLINGMEGQIRFLINVNLVILNILLIGGLLYIVGKRKE